MQTHVKEKQYAWKFMTEDQQTHRLVRSDAIRRMITAIESKAMSVYWCNEADGYKAIEGHLEKCLAAIAAIETDDHRECPDGYTEVGGQCVPAQ